ncbi:MAG: LamG domain-containing protein [Cyanothece sp. SIO1E1]|nr:LamG domain-containing protein [Cyanothece sp. SIO1E1]
MEYYDSSLNSATPFAARREASTLTYFADGQPVASLTTARIGNYNISSDQALLIGWDLVNRSATPFKGSIDEVRIWNRALSDAEIKSGISRSMQSDEIGLLGYWSFDEGSGELVRDRSGNNYHGVIFGASWLSERN